MQPRLSTARSYAASKRASRRKERESVAGRIEMERDDKRRKRRNPINNEDRPFPQKISRGVLSAFLAPSRGREGRRLRREEVRESVKGRGHFEPVGSPASSTIEKESKLAREFDSHKGGGRSSCSRQNDKQEKAREGYAVRSESKFFSGRARE